MGKLSDISNVVNYGKVANALDEVVNVKDFGAVGDGVTDNTTAIQNALNAGNNIFLGEGTYLIKTDITVSDTKKIIFANNAKIKINDGVTVTFNGQIDAGLHQIFEYVGTGAVVNLTQEVFTIWWGGDIGAQINAAVAALLSNKGIINIPAGTFNFNTPIVLSNNITLQGAGKGSSILVWTGTDNTQDIVTTNGNELLLQNFNIHVNDGGAVHSIINVDSTRLSHFLNLYLYGNSSDNTKVLNGIYGENNIYYNLFENVYSGYCNEAWHLIGNGVTQNTFINCSASSSAQYGFHGSGHKFILIGCFFENNSDTGFYSTYGEVILLGNYFEGNVGTDILVNYQTGSVILGNRINVNQTKNYAIRCLGSGDTTHRGVQIASNTIFITAGTLSYAFDLSGQIRMSNNSAIENGGTLTNFNSKSVGVTINNVGESSDSGAPTSDLWEIGSIIHQTGDNTWWIKGIDGNWAQIA